MRPGLRAAGKSADKRESKVRVPTIKARSGPTKRRPTKKELEMDRQLNLQDIAPNVYGIIEKGQTSKKYGGKIKGYKKGGPITYRMTGGQVVDNSYD